MIASGTDLDLCISFRRRNSPYARQITDRHNVFFRYADNRRRVARQCDIPAKVAVLLCPSALDLAVNRPIGSGDFVQAVGKHRFHHQLFKPDGIRSAFDTGQVFVIPDQQVAEQHHMSSSQDQPCHRSKVPRSSLRHS